MFIVVVAEPSSISMQRLKLSFLPRSDIRSFWAATLDVTVAVVLYLSSDISFSVGLLWFYFKTKVDVLWGCCGLFGQLQSMLRGVSLYFFAS